MPYCHASMLLLGEGSEATDPNSKYDKIRPHSIRSLQFDQKFRPLSLRPEKFDLFTATHSMILKKRAKVTTSSDYFDLHFLLPTSNLLERFFSVAGLALTNLRQRLTPEHLEQQLFLKANSKLWNIHTVSKVLNKEN